MALAIAKVFYSDPTTPYWPHDLQDSPILKELNKPLLRLTSPAAQIAFHPDWSVYETRRTGHEQDEKLEKAVPLGWPARLDGPLAWKGTNLRNDTDYIYHLSEADKAEIKLALKQVEEENLAFDDIKEDTFALLGLMGRLKEAQSKVYNGIGFVVFRGLNVERYSRKECLRIFLGISSHLAAHRGAQDQNGNLLKHLVDYSRVDSDVELPIHTDIIADIVATLTIESSKYGGEAILSSSWTVYNELAATRPDLIHVLARSDWPFDTYGRNPAYYNRALLYYHDDKALINFSSRVLTSHPISPRTKGIPGLTDTQAEALDAVHFIAKKHKLNVATKKGDMRFINNFAILHGREAYGDHDVDVNVDMTEQGSQRHLYRLWLHNDRLAWKLPPALKLVWARTFNDTRCRTWNAAHEVIPGSPQLSSPKLPPPQPPFPCD